MNTTNETSILLTFLTRSDSLRIDIGISGGMTLSMVLRASRTCHKQGLKDYKRTSVLKLSYSFAVLFVFLLYARFHPF